MASDCCDLLCLDLPTAEGVRAAMPDADAVARLAAVAQACADPTRLALLLAMEAAPELCVCDLTWVVGRPQNLVSHHLRKLRDAGMVRTRREARIVFYSLSDTARSALGTLGQVEVTA
jgi:DNA-binding transcriptional ArsR family regulator